MVVDILILVLILMFIASLPVWSYSRRWGYAGSGGILVLLLIVLILFHLNVF
jgi:hypothetical protein